MTQALTKSRPPQSSTIEQALVQGDLSGLDPEQRVAYLLKVCLTRSEVEQVRTLADAGTLTQRQIAAMFGITQSDVSRIKTRGIWK